MRSVAVVAIAALISAGPAWKDASAGAGSALVGIGNIGDTPLSGASGAGSGTIGTPGSSPAVHPLEFGQANIAIALDELGYEDIANLSIKGDTFTANAEREGQAVRLRGQRLPSGDRGTVSVREEAGVRDLLERHGFTEIGSPRRSGDTLTAQAIASGKSVIVHLDTNRRLLIEAILAD